MISRGERWAIYGLLVVLVLVTTAQSRITPAPGNVPAAGIILIDSGSCPGGFTELTAARGRFVVGTPASGTLAGTAGTPLTDLQNPSVTPTFSGVALAGHLHTFTGSALSTHQHEAPVNLDGSVLGIGSTFGTGTSRTYTGVSGPTAATTGGSLTSAVSAGTPAGTLDSVSAGTPAGTVSAVASNSLAPYLQLTLCKRS